MWSIVVHGGAGAISKAVESAHRRGVSRAAEAGAAVLAAGGPSLDAVVAAVRVLEADPTFNAGRGGALDERGLVSSDAAVMRGSDLAYGAVGAVAGVPHPVDLARAVLDDGRHALLVGPGAVDFARRKGMKLVDPLRLRTEHAITEWRRRQAEALEKGGDPFAGWSEAPGERHDGDTVGAVAQDARGVIAAATSTGGLTMRYPGRVGDSPIAGAGTYARDDLGGVSCTGHGETMMKTVLAYHTLIALRGAAPSHGGVTAAPRCAADILRRVLDDATARVGGRGGLIVVLPDGTTAYARNTAHMGVAWVSALHAVASDF